MKSVKRVHFRRCHLCSGISESEGDPVKQCQHCGKWMAPFYFFDDMQVSPLSDSEMRAEGQEQPGNRRPVRGFTAHW